MDIELTLKLIALLVSAIGTWKVLPDLVRARRATIREEYHFAKEFFADLRSKEPIHPYVREKGFEALADGRPLTAREIEYLLNMPEPARSLREYATGKKYLEHAATAGDRQILVRKRYRRSWVLQALLWLYLLFFFSAYAGAWSPFFFSSMTQELGLRIGVALPVTLLTFGPFAYFFFRQAFFVANALAVIRRDNIRHGKKR